MANIDANELWARIQAHQGEIFRQILGGEFSYELVANSLVPDRTNQNIPRAYFHEALRLVPLESTVPLQHLRGPSYIFAVLMDSRIRKSDW